MANEEKQVLGNLKKIELKGLNVTLAVVKEYKKERISQYTIKYVPIDEKLENRLSRIVINHINNSDNVEAYSFDCPDPEEDQVRAIKYEETDFYRIMDNLKELNPEEDIIENIDELIKSKAYMIVLRNAEGIQIVGFKTLPENWKLKRAKHLINLLYVDNRFEDIEQENIFSISSLVDLFYFNEYLFILSKKEFERGLNFREGMINNAQEMYNEVSQINLFINMEILTQRVGNNQRYLRKISTIRNLGHYRNPTYLRRLKQLSMDKRWNIQFENEQIVITEESLDDILTLLQNKRLHSELTDEDFDVESVKPLQNQIDG